MEVLNHAGAAAKEMSCKTTVLLSHVYAKSLLGPETAVWLQGLGLGSETLYLPLVGNVGNICMRVAAAEL